MKLMYFTFLLLLSFNSVADRIIPDDYYILARAMYFEAAGEPEMGVRAVGHVIINRYNSSNWPDSIVEVIRQPPRAGNDPYKCQFSYTCDDIPDIIKPRDYLLFHEISMVAWRLLAGEYHYDPTFGADHYLRCDVIYKTNWDWSRLEFTIRIGDHCFFKQITIYQVAYNG